jgi:hypothetical protein
VAAALKAGVITETHGVSGDNVLSLSNDIPEYPRDTRERQHAPLRERVQDRRNRHMVVNRRSSAFWPTRFPVISGRNASKRHWVSNPPYEADSKSKRRSRLWDTGVRYWAKAPVLPLFHRAGADSLPFGEFFLSELGVVDRTGFNAARHQRGGRHGQEERQDERPVLACKFHQEHHA